MTTNPEAASLMTTQPAGITAQPEAMCAADLTPAAAWSRRVRRIGAFIQAAFAAFWLARASLAIGGRTGGVLLGTAAAGRLPRPRG
jgi:hypothetical protein